MKQLLLRVPEDLHQRLTARAARAGRSVNSLASELLDVGADADEGGRRARLRMRAALIGVAARSVEAPPAEGAEVPDHDAIDALTRGWGAIADDLIRAERDTR